MTSYHTDGRAQSKEQEKTGSLSLMMEHGILYIEPRHMVEEGMGDQCQTVGVAEDNKVHVLGEAVNHSQDNRLAAHIEKAFNEVHRNVSLEGVAYVQCLQQACGMEVFGFVVLADRAPLHKVPH